MCRYKIAGSTKKVCKQKDEAAPFHFFKSILLWNALETGGGGGAGKMKWITKKKKKIIN